jgi:hypothetical protein
MCFLSATKWAFISQETTFFIVTAVKISNITRLKWFRNASFQSGRVHIIFKQHQRRIVTGQLFSSRLKTQDCDDKADDVALEGTTDTITARKLEKGTHANNRI